MATSALFLNEDQANHLRQAARCQTSHERMFEASPHKFRILIPQCVVAASVPGDLEAESITGGIPLASEQDGMDRTEATPRHARLWQRRRDWPVAALRDRHFTQIGKVRIHCGMDGSRSFL